MRNFLKKLIVTLLALATAAMPLSSAAFAAEAEDPGRGVYTVALAEAEHGSLSFNGAEGTEAQFAEGGEVNLIIVPDDGYRLGRLELLLTDTMECAAEDESGAETYTFTMPAADVTVRAEFEETDDGQDTVLEGGQAAATPDERDGGTPYVQAEAPVSEALPDDGETPGAAAEDPGDDAGSVQAYSIDPDTAPDSVTLLPDDTDIPPSDTKITFSGISVEFSDELEAEGAWINTTDSGAVYPYIPIKTDGATYEDPMKITAKDAAEIDGRSIDVELMVKEIQYGSLSSSSVTRVNEYDIAYGTVMYVSSTGRVEFHGLGRYWTDSDRNVHTSSSDTTAISPSGQTNLTYTLSVRWSDTGEIVELPFYQVAYDLDMGSTLTSAESYTFMDGIDRYYVYEGTQLQCVEYDYGMYFGATRGTDYTGDDSYKLAGVIAHSSNGTFTASCRSRPGCWNYFEAYSDYLNIADPEKSVASEGSNYNGTFAEGDEATYEITQKMGEIYVDCFGPYDSLSITDSIPEGLTYVDMAAYSGSTLLGSSDGRGEYDAGTRTLTWTFSDGWVSNTDNYLGQDIRLIVTCSIDAGFLNGEQSKTITNTAASYFSGLEYGPASASMTVSSEPSMLITKEIIDSAGDAADGGTFYEGDAFTYKITVVQGMADTKAENVTVTDTLPGNGTAPLEVIEVTADNADASYSGTDITADCGTMAYGDTATIYVKVKVHIPEDYDGTAQETVNTAYVTADDTGVKSASCSFFLSEKKTGSVTVTKTVAGTESRDLGGFAFRLSGTSDDGGTVEEYAVTDSAGRAEFSGIPAGTGYELSEVSSKAVSEAAEAGNASAKEVSGSATQDLSEYREASPQYADVAGGEAAEMSFVNELASALRITKTSDRTDYNPDEEIVYTITVQETVPGAAAYDVEVSDELPDGLTLTGVPALSGAEGSVEADGSALAVSIPELKYAQDAVITVAAAADGSLAGETVTNTAYVTDGSGDSDDDSTAVRILHPGLSVTKSVSDGPYNIGDTVEYTITVCDPVSGSVSTDVTMEDNLPDGLTPTGDITLSGAEGTACVTDNGYSVSIPILSSGETAIVTVRAYVDASAAGHEITNEAYAWDAYGDADRSAAAIDVLQPALSISKEADLTSCSVGDAVTYTITVNETVPGARAKNVTITDTLPDGMELINAESDTGKVAADGNSITVYAGDMASSDTATVTVTAKALNEGTSTNTAYAAADYTDTVSDSAEVTASLPGLSISKKADAAEYCPGDTVTYEIRVANDAEDGGEAYNAVVRDVLPGELDLISVTAPGGETECDGNVVTVIYDKISAGEEKVITVEAEAYDCGNTKVRNTACVSSDTTDEISDYADISIVTPVLSVAKEAGNDSYSIGDEVSYGIKVTQTEPGVTAYNVSVSDSLPQELILKDAVIEGAEGEGEAFIDGNSLEVLIPELAFGEAAHITVTAEASSPSEEVVNTAYAGADYADTVSSSATIAIVQPALSIVKSSDRDACSAGDEILYTITVTQTAEGAAERDVVIADELPSGLTLAGTAELSGAEGTVTVSGNSITADIPELAYGCEAVIAFKASADEDAAGSTVVNTAYASGSHAGTVSDSAETAVYEDAPITAIQTGEDRTGAAAAAVGASAAIALAAAAATRRRRHA